MLQTLVMIASSGATKGETLRAVNSRIVRMDLQEQVELLCRVDIFESLPKEEVRDILGTSSSEMGRSILHQEKSSTLPKSQTAASSSSRKAGYASTGW